MAEKKRLSYIDAAKGLAVLLVIFGHTFRESMRADFVWCDVSYVIVYRFHVSLLFLLSGLGYGLAAQRYREQTPGEFLRRKARSLLLPWLSYSVLMYLVFALIWAVLPLRGMLSGSAYALISPGRYLLDMLGNENPYCFHVWYLQTLFLLTAAVYFCDRLLSPRASRAVRITAALLIPLLYELFCHGWVWTGKAFMQKAVFFLVGTLLPERVIREHSRAFAAAGIGCGALTGLLIYSPFDFDPYAARLTGIPTFYLENAAVLGLCLGITAFMALLCRRAEQRGTELRLARFGRQTLPYYLYPQPFCCAFLGLLLYEKLGVPAPAVVIICMAAGLTVPYLLIRLLGGTRIGAAAERIGLPMGASRRISETESANGSI